MAAADAVAAHLQQHPAFARPGYVAGYWAVGGELPLHALQLSLRPDQIWCLPCVQDDGSLGFSPWRPGDPLVTNRYGIPEPNVASASLLKPNELHLVLLPLLGFDRTGHRLGMGGGYYDRSFAFRHDAAAPPTLIGVGYALQELPKFDAGHWDVPLDAVVTETGLVEFER
jgi:5-formyltetrahydrofolate cyclo-ligase